jgi:hypothetical protein
MKLSVPCGLTGPIGSGTFIGPSQGGPRVSIRRTLAVDASPAKALAALATAGENLDYDVRRADPSLGVLVMTSPWTREAVSFGYIATARASAGSQAVEVEIDVTPRAGFWAIEGSARQADELLDELRYVLKAPEARIRRPEQLGRPDRPFGYRPEIAGAVWAIASLVVFGLLVGGRWWLAAAAGVLGGGLMLRPKQGKGWTVPVALAGFASLPFGLVGLTLRREALAQAYWQALKRDG